MESLEGVLCQKRGQHGPNLGSKMEPKSMKNEVENQSNFQCLLELIFYAILVDFWWKIELWGHQNRGLGEQNGGPEAPKTRSGGLLAGSRTHFRPF